DSSLQYEMPERVTSTPDLPARRGPRWLQDAAANQAVAGRLRRLETVRRIAPVQEHLGMLLAAVPATLRIGDLDPPVVLDAVYRARGRFSVQRMSCRLAREIE